MKICFFGDSFTNGTGDDECLGWVGRVCAEKRREGIDLTAYNLGIRGNTSEDVMRRWKGEACARVAKGENSALIFSFGTNDCAKADDGRSRLAQNDRLKNARSILVDAPKLHQTLFIGPLPIADDPIANKRIADLSRQMGVFARTHKVPYLELYPTFAESSVWAQECAAGDGVHPNSGGYAAVADMVAKWDAWQALFQ